MEILGKYKKIIEENDFTTYQGQVLKIVGLTIEAKGPAVEIGELCDIYPQKGKKPIAAEVVGFKGEHVLLMPLGEMSGIGPGSRVIASGSSLRVRVGQALLGRVLDGLGNPMDGKPPIETYQWAPVDNTPPNPLSRSKIRSVLPLGIRAIDGLLTCGRGQRVGIFAGSGVGKSTLLGMIARNTEADINVIALVGERGREVKEFIDHDLGPEGLKRSVVIVATSDQPALVRVKAALLATAVAEYFRDQNNDVLLMMDSVTRFSMAQREIGLAVGEPPVTKGYTPSVFAMLPRLLERAGTADQGSITALYTVLVDADDFNEPISDAVRGILDGHIMLSRRLASFGQYPAIDVLDSISRVMPVVADKEHIEMAREFRETLSTYRINEDMITIGAYAKGSNPKIDRAIDLHEDYLSFLKQDVEEPTSFEDTLDQLNALTGDPS